MDSRTPPFPDFLRDGGETGELIRTYDWANTPIGPLPGWPQSLRTTVGLMLRSPVPMVLLWGENGVMIYNDAYSVFAGGRHPHLLGSNVLEGWPEVADFNANVMEVGLSGGILSYRDQELTLYRKGVPEQVWMNLDYSPVRDESGRPGGVLAIVIETTERVQAERHRKVAEDDLRQERDRTRSVLNNMGEALVLLDHELRFIEMNAEAKRLEQRPAEQLIGKTHWENHPDASPELGHLFQKALAKQMPASLEHHYVWPDGRETWIEMRAHPIEEGLAVFYRDITPRKSAESALRESQTELQLLMDSMPVLVSYMEAAPELRYRFLNKIYEQWFPHKREDIQGKPVREVVGEKAYAHVKPWIERAMAGERLTFEQFMPYKEGGSRHIRVEYVPRVAENNRVLGIYALVQDITENKRSEEHQRLLINELNHRVKNTLATVQSIVTQTLRNAATPNEAKEAVESRLLALSRAHDVLTRENWEGADLYEIVEQAVAPYSSRGEDRLHLKGPHVRLPPRMALALAMALQELATNAVKYGALSNETGEIDIEWSLTRTEDGLSLHLQWKEGGGPPVRKPTRQGFGTRLIQRSLAQDLGGEVKITFAPTGLVCTVETPLLSA